VEDIDKMEENWLENEKKDLPPKYSCQILLENGTTEQLKDTSWPNDAYIITYKINDKIYKDLCRGSRVKIFDLYYDKFGANVVKDIDFGYGRVNPRMWGYVSKNNKANKK
jgi:hypothetical protein